MERVKIASIHGRFQPFHNGHLDYALQAFERADFISVGLAQIFKPRFNEDEKGRNSVSANPLSFEQRSNLVKAALLEAGIDRTRFDIIPFPIEQPSRLREFVRPGMVCFTTQLNPWNAEKIRLLEREGFEVIRLRVSEIDGKRVATGTTIRELIRSGDQSWQRFVPPAVFELIGSEYLEHFKLGTVPTLSALSSP